MKYSVRCPLQFWKICVLIRRDGTPSATGFVLGQEDIQNLPGFEESFRRSGYPDQGRRSGRAYGSGFRGYQGIRSLRRWWGAGHTGAAWHRGGGSARENHWEWQRYRRVTISPAVVRVRAIKGRLR